MRNLLEVKAAQLAAEHADDAGRRRLSLLAEKISKAYEEQEEKEFLDYEMEFHRCVAQCSGNQVIYSMLETISNLMRRLSATGMTGVHQQEEIYQENQRIYSLIPVSYTHLYRILYRDGCQAGSRSNLFLPV